MYVISLDMILEKVDKSSERKVNTFIMVLKQFYLDNMMNAKKKPRTTKGKSLITYIVKAA